MRAYLLVMGVGGGMVTWGKLRIRARDWAGSEDEGRSSIGRALGVVSTGIMK